MRASLLLAAVAAGLVGCDAFPLSTYSMSSESMLPTLQKGDIVGADGWKGQC